ncbi:HAD family hydrolase [Cellulomonas triticagri]|uniref:HAD family hydrolase n=1 Tax=Cellulomonas triticagri TaxID=2483352 RepID=UPI0018F46E61|nr:HAD family hydrolase [Cellulomonas triticagri]
MPLVATDLDGTLLRSDGTVSPYTAEVLRALDAQGVPVLFVTARPLRWMTDLWPLVGRHGLAVLSNGAVWYDVAGQRVRELRGIEPRAGIALCAELAQALPGAAFAIECLDGIRFDPDYVPDDYSAPDRPRGPLCEVWTSPAAKILVQGTQWQPSTLREIATSTVGDRAIVTWTSPHLLELSAPGVTKATTLARICTELGVPADDVVAFGDMPNDSAMLRWAGRSHAVANADREVLDLVDEVIPANDDDGVARTLQTLFSLTVHPR